MRKLASLVGLAAVLGVAYCYDLYVLTPMRREAGSSFDPGPLIWTTAAAHIAIALAVVGLAWMVFRWSPPSRAVGATYLLAGFALAAAWPIAAAGGGNIPGFPELNLYFVLAQYDGLLSLIAPFLAAIGFVRLVLPLPARLRTAGERHTLGREPTTAL